MHTLNNNFRAEHGGGGASDAGHRDPARAAVPPGLGLGLGAGADPDPGTAPSPNRRVSRITGSSEDSPRRRKRTLPPREKLGTSSSDETKSGQWRNSRGAPSC